MHRATYIGLRAAGLVVLALLGCNGATDLPPLDTALDVQVTVAGTEAIVTWGASTAAESYRVTLTAAGEQPRSRDVPATATSASFQGLTPGVTYSAQVAAVRGRELAAAEAVSFRVPDPYNDLLNGAQAGMRTSLHGTSKGMEYWYEHPDGMANHGGPDYSALMCSTCHVYNATLTGVSSETPCLACHPASTSDPGKPNYAVVNQAQCLKCHSRQAAEIAMNLPDVHRTAGMGCVDCHPADQVHGSGSPGEATMFHALKVECISCHGPGGNAPPAPGTSAHTIHTATVACQSCHMSGSVTCYNCHLKDEIVNKKKTAYARYADWLFLGNYRGKVHPLNFQSVEYEGTTFNAWGPFTGHTITREGRMCSYCHGHPNVRAVAAGPFAVTKWDPASATMAHAQGVIPVPRDYSLLLRFDYVTRNAAGGWSFVETGPEKSQMLFATPLTPLQLSRMVSAR